MLPFFFAFYAIIRSAMKFLFSLFLSALFINASVASKSIFSFETGDADATDYCDDLWETSKLELEVDDDTGIATNYLYNSPYDARFNLMLSQIPEKLMSRYDEALKNTEEPIVESLISKIFIARPNFKSLKECRESSQSSECRNILVKFLTDFTMKRLSMFYAVSASNEKEKEEAYGLLSITKNKLIAQIELEVIRELGKTLVTKQLSDRISKVIMTPEKRLKLKSKKVKKERNDDIFTRVKGYLKSIVVRDFKNDPSVLKNFLTRLEDLSFGGFDCSELSRVDLNKSISSNFYITDDNRVLFCPGSLRRNQSEYSMVWFLAHEMAHLIGPCHLDTLVAPLDVLNFNSASYSTSPVHLSDIIGNIEEVESVLPYGNVMSCLRRENAAGVTRSFGRPYADDVILSSDVKAGGFFCPKLNGTEALYEGNDQIDESFSDWMATEVLSEYMNFYFKNFSIEQKRKGLSNVFRGSDEFIKNSAINQTGTPLYLSTENRINRILFAHPSIRKQVGCGDRPYKYQYCSKTH